MVCVVPPIIRVVWMSRALAKPVLASVKTPTFDKVHQVFVKPCPISRTANYGLPKFAPLDSRRNVGIEFVAAK